jgi:hypothetical protein
MILSAVFVVLVEREVAPRFELIPILRTQDVDVDPYHQEKDDDG